MKNLSLLILIGLACASIFPVTVSAQINGIKSGDRVKIDAPLLTRNSIIGTVTEVSPSVITLSVNDSTIYVINSTVERLAISVGKKRNIEKGLLWGAGIGAIFSSMIGGAIYSCNSNGFECLDKGVNAAALSIGLGVLAGGAIGAIIGNKPSDQWENVPIKFSTAPVTFQTDKFNVNPTVTFRISF